MVYDREARRKALCATGETSLTATVIAIEEQLDGIAVEISALPAGGGSPDMTAFTTAPNALADRVAAIENVGTVSG